MISACLISNALGDHLWSTTMLSQDHLTAKFFFDNVRIRGKAQQIISDHIPNLWSYYKNEQNVPVDQLIFNTAKMGPRKVKNSRILKVQFQCKYIKIFLTILKTYKCLLSMRKRPEKQIAVALTYYVDIDSRKMKLQEIADVRKI